MKKAVVLSGGGARGAYQIGVWHALRKLKYRYDIVTGTSVGALNGVFLVQKDFSQAVSFWKNISTKEIFSEEVADKDETLEEKKELLLQYFKKATHGGFNVSELEKNIEKLLNVKKFFDSPVDYGLVTYNLTTLTPLEITKKELTKETLKDYLIASATCFPAFNIKKINNEDFIDGGYYDNMPVNLAIKLGAKEVVAVDLNSIGFQRKVKDKTVKITYIKPNNHLSSFLAFNKKYSIQAMKYGFNDTMKAFHKCYGIHYTFKKYRFMHYYRTYNEQFQNLLLQIISKKDSVIFEQLFNLFPLKKIKKKYYENDLKSIEELAAILGIDDTLIYRYSKFNQLLKQKIEVFTPMEPKKLEEIMEKNWKQIFDKKNIIRYFYDKIKNNDYENLKKFAILFPKELAFSIYLAIL